MTDNNVIDFPRIGFTLTPTAPVVPPPDTSSPAPAPAPAPVPGSGRRSPLDILNTLPDPGIRQPVIPTAPAPLPGQVPDTFRNDAGPDDAGIGPRLGALSLAAILAVAVAALRGAHTVTSTWWERRQARLAEGDPIRQARLKHQLAMQNIGDKAAQQRAKQIPSSHDYGRKTLSRLGGGRGGGAGSGGGRGKSNRPGGLLSSGSGSNRSSGSKTARGGASGDGKGKGKGGLFGGGSGTGKQRNNRTNNGAGTGTGRGPKTKGPKAPHRPTQGAGAALKKHRGKNDTPNSGKGGRTSLAGALKKDTHKAANRRLNKRRKNGLDTPALWKNDQARGKKADLAKRTPNGKNSGKANGNTKTNGTGNSQNTSKTGKQQRARRGLWSAIAGDTAHRAARRFKRRQHQRKTGATPPIWTAPKNRRHDGGKATSGDSAQARKQTSKERTRQSGGRHAGWWERARDYARKHGTSTRNDRPGTPGPGPNTGTAGTGRATGGRRSPFENAGQAGAPRTWTVERDDYVGAQAKKWQPAGITTGTAALPPVGQAQLAPAPTTHTPLPGTTRPRSPIPMPPTSRKLSPVIAQARKDAERAAQQTVGQEMDPQHETEITLDEACDGADQLADDCFNTHDECVSLAKKARNLRDTWIEFAEYAAVHHNLIGTLFTAAAVKFGESMELLARMAEEMETSSLEAAEKCETAGNELNDAYRPITQATADGGLTTPSAPAHNRA